jgi:hypothetical protein
MASRPIIHWGRIRLPFAAACFALTLVAWFTSALPGWAGALGLVAGLALYARVGAPRERAPRSLRAPVAGRWRAFNSPADKVPSHGIHAYGQSFAVDLVHEPRGTFRPGLGWWPPARRPERFPGFGREVRSPAAGVVVRARDRRRDHWSRTSYPAIAYMLAEAAVRELTGPTSIFGNHLVLDIGGGEYVALAHLERGSLRVRPGDRVAAGEVVARCGNSGNSSEPHLHIQCMDHPNPLLADGVPFFFADVDVDGGLPSRAHPFTPRPAG